MKRVLTALVLLPIVIWVVLAGPSWLFLALMAIVGVAAFHEYDSIIGGQHIPRSGVVGMVAGLALLLSPEPAIVTLVVLSAMLMIWALREADLSKAMTGAAMALLGIVFIFGAWRCAAALRNLNPHWLIIAFLVCWAGDTAALYIGRAFGRHKLAPQVSPSKTWEGAWASLVASVLAVGVYAHFLIPAASLPMVLTVGALGNIAGQFGDLCESALKRGSGVKDSGSTLPGHGGWLDRIDAALFSIPAVYALLNFWQLSF